MTDLQTPLSYLTPARLLWIQAAYYLLTGLWPLLSIESFLAITGPKTDHLQSPRPNPADHWLVMTAGVLITSVGLSLLVAAWRAVAAPETITLAIAVAVGLTGIDLIYVSRGVIAAIYLGDAVIEVLLLSGWFYVLSHDWRKGPPTATVPVEQAVPVTSEAST